MRPWLVLTCQQLTLVANDYLEERLGLAARAQAWLHLSWCRPCRAYLRQLRQTVATLRRLPRAQPPLHLAGELRRRLRALRGDGAE